MRTVAAVWGTHPNEEHALEVGKSLVSRPIENVHAVTANKEAIRQGKRLIDMNMAYAYPGSHTSSCYEERQAARVMDELRKLKPDVTSDIHSIIGGEMHAVIGTKMGVAPWVLGSLKGLGIKYIVTYEANVHAQYPNTFGLEIASSEVERRGIGFVRDFFEKLANNSTLPVARPSEFEWFTYSKVGGGGLNASVIHPDDFTPQERAQFGSFKPLPPRIQALAQAAHGKGSIRQLYAQSDLHQPNEQGYFTDLLEKIAAPNTSNWPR